MPAEPSMDWSAGDPSSFCRPTEVVVTSLHVQLKVDFSARVLIGSVQLNVRRVDPSATYIVLDTRHLDIEKVVDSDTGAALTYRLGEEHAALGTPLTIDLPSGDAPAGGGVTVHYRTRPECTALAWMTAEQTAGKQQPFLFSQCQAIHCRSLLPCQDSPSVKFTYTAELHVSAGLTALMSAVRRQDSDGPAESGVFRYEQTVPVPAYLVALAVGRLEARRLSQRCQVWAEPETVAAAADEFVDTERMLSIAEQLCGPYVWGVYDLLVLPPSFPFGGMENPCLTFLTPTLLAGDRSLADVVAHEICHSWTGNLVTNRNWEHFWLNEGFTTFLERKIRGRMFGEPERHLSAIVGWRSLKETVAKLEKQNAAAFTWLVPRLEGVDPDDAFSCIPYEKGHTLLWSLEQMVGGPEEFEPFLRAYIDKFKYKTVDSDHFRHFLQEHFGDKVSAVDWDGWLNTAGMPPFTPQFDTALTDACSRLSARWSDWDGLAEPCPFSGDELHALSAGQLVEFLGQLLEGAPLTVAQLSAMERLYGMDARRNAEVRLRWLRLCVAGRWTRQIDACLQFVSEQGRMKFTVPLYGDLYGWAEARDKAVSNYKSTRSAMMHVSAVAIGKKLQLQV